MRQKKKAFISLFLTAVLAFALTGCGAAKDAQTAFDTMMQAFQTGDQAQISAYYDFEAVSKFINEEDGAELQDVILSTLKKMTYEVESAEKQDGSAVKISAKVTTLDFSEVMNRYIAQVMAMVASEEYQARVAEMTQQEYQKLLAEQMRTVLEQSDIPTAENSVTVTMVKEDGTWKAGGDKEAFLGALFANLTNAVNSLV